MILSTLGNLKSIILSHGRIAVVRTSATEVFSSQQRSRLAWRDVFWTWLIQSDWYEVKQGHDVTQRWWGSGVLGTQDKENRSIFGSATVCVYTFVSRAYTFGMLMMVWLYIVVPSKGERLLSYNCGFASGSSSASNCLVVQVYQLV